MVALIYQKTHSKLKCIPIPHPPQVEVEVATVKL